ncbi:hypothetical protein M5K25_005420 [Dendrobium thyrsiflorum]|uniref:CS domain-containing protein n=1 Tax=Dendrobium thyrsiflorum TaxID=117978 RepID=A0ABD0VIY1_DENTH
MAEEQQLRLDLEELRHLESVAKRPRVLSLLSSEIHSVDAKLANIRAVAAKPVVSNDQSSVTTTVAALNYITLGSFSWDQDNEKIKIEQFQSTLFCLRKFVHSSWDDFILTTVQAYFAALLSGGPLLAVQKFQQAPLAVQPSGSFVFDDQGLIDIFWSPFFDIDFESDQFVEDCVERILSSLATAISQQHPPVQWRLPTRDKDLLYFLSLDVMFHTLAFKIYVFLEGVNEENVESNFGEMSVDVKFHDVQGKNYRISFPKLNKEIVPEKCKVLVKPTKIIISLFKASKGNWLDLQFKEDKVSFFMIIYFFLD